MTNKIVFTFILFINIFSYAADELCFSTLAEYETVKPKLPKILQELPHYFAIENASVTVAVFKVSVTVAASLFFAEGKLRLYINATKGMPEDFEPPTKLCVKDNVIKTIFPNGQHETFKVLSDTEIVASNGIKLPLVSKVTFDRIKPTVDAASPKTAKKYQQLMENAQ